MKRIYEKKKSNMSSKIHYIYIANYLKETVTDSQIIGWLKLLEERGIVFDLLLLVDVKRYFRKRKLLMEKIQEAEQTLSGKIYNFPIIKPGSFVGNFLTLIILLSIILKSIINHNKIIVQTRNPYNFISFKILKKIYPNVKIVYDSRAALADEFLLTQNRLNRNNWLSCKSKSYDKILRKDKDFIGLSDKVLCVSNKLKEYHLSKNKEVDDNKFIIIPGCSDSKDFFWSEHKRNKMRNFLNVEDRLVLLYSGGLNKAWQMPEFIFHFFSKISETIQDIFFMCLTPHANTARNYIEKFNISEDNIWTGYIKYNQLVNYLCAADVGLLFREDISVNNVASPTKFSEYILCGLPVIISKGIGDFSEFVEKNEIGLVLDHDSADCDRNIEHYLRNLNPDRKRIAEIGNQYYSKQKCIDKIMNVYKDLVSL